MEGVGKVDSCEVGALAFSLLAKLIRFQCNGEAASLKMEIWEACSDGNRFCISYLSIPSSIQVMDDLVRGGVHIDPFNPIKPVFLDLTTPEGGLICPQAFS